MTPLLARTLRRSKHYVLSSAFISGVALTTRQFVPRSQTASGSNSLHKASSLLAACGTSVMRVATMVLWFDRTASLKPNVLGDKRVQMTA
ncbi:hypothetical protein Gpo141_00012044 [Globisporangium polare]